MTLDELTIKFAMLNRNYRELLFSHNLQQAQIDKLQAEVERLSQVFAAKHRMMTRLSLN